MELRARIKIPFLSHRKLTIGLLYADMGFRLEKKNNFY